MRLVLEQVGFSDEPASFGPLLLVAAHPDDETIGAGAQLPRWRGAQVTHVTDGAPRDGRDARAAGFAGRVSYARARQREALEALRLAGLNSGCHWQLPFVDQEAALHLKELVLALLELFVRIRPATVITHPYEGGHPDHDATAFGVHMAIRLLQRSHQPSPTLLEFTSYHNRAGNLASGEFLPQDGAAVVTLPLNKAATNFKQRLFHCFPSQQRVLQAFRLDQERFRVAPAYDFTRPAHPGVLYYEMFNWGMTGQRWCSLAAAALEQLECRAEPPAYGVDCP